MGHGYIWVPQSGFSYANSQGVPQDCSEHMYGLELLELVEIQMYYFPLK